jgi:hypothetical protein
MLIPTIPSPEITAALDRSERVLWSGQPRRGLMLRGADAFAIPFSLIWGGGASMGAWASFHGRDPFGMLVGGAFALMGLYLIFRRFFVDAAQRRRTFYAVTNERIIIVSGLLSRSVKSLSLRTLDQIDLSSRASGEGTISFGRSMYGSFTLAGWAGMKGYLPPMFERIPDAAEVARLIRDAQRAVTTPAERA